MAPTPIQNGSQADAEMAAGSSRSFAAIRKDTGVCCGSRLRKGEAFAYVERNQNLKDLKDMAGGVRPPGLLFRRAGGMRARRVAARVGRTQKPQLRLRPGTPVLHHRHRLWIGGETWSPVLSKEDNVFSEEYFSNSDSKKVSLLLIPVFLFQ